MWNPLALPIHPILVHFSIALLSVAWICLLVRYASGSQRWEEWWRISEFAGVLTLPLTIATAFIDTRGFDFLVHPRVDAPLIWHMTAGLVASAAFAAHYLWRRRAVTTTTPTTSLIALDIALVTFGMIALIASGLIAGELVYGA
jgi:uncharacterized membrane protein